MELRDYFVELRDIMISKQGLPDDSNVGFFDQKVLACSQGTDMIEVCFNVKVSLRKGRQSGRSDHNRSSSDFHQRS